MLTKEQLKQIEDIIRRRFSSFTFEALGKQALSQSEIRVLQQAGLLRPNIRNMVGDSYTLGKIAALFKRKEAKNLTFQQILERASEMKPLTGVEEQAIRWAAEHAGQYIQGLSDDMVRDVRGAVARTSMSAVRAVQEEVATAIAERKTVTELKSALENLIDDKARDWHRVASTEVTSAIQSGIANEIRDSYGPDALVYKRPNPDGCKHCFAAYVKSDRVTPKTFKLSDLADNNYGRKAANWLPTIGPLHPYCQCQLMFIPKGFDFVINEDGIAELSYTGKQAKVTGLKKSLGSDIDCCDHVFEY
ncbi:hypothetical protein EBR03_09415 [bacterium]|nr:hypothetical protein [bacterium]